MHNGRHVDGFLDQATQQYQTQPLWRGMIGWILVAVLFILITELVA